MPAAFSVATTRSPPLIRAMLDAPCLGACD
jgi:hypothetical protein